MLTTCPQVDVTQGTVSASDTTVPRLKEFRGTYLVRGYDFRTRPRRRLLEAQA